MQMVTFRVNGELHEDIKNRAHQLGFSSKGEYLRTLVTLDIHGARMLDKGTMADVVDQEPAGAEQTDPEPPEDQSDPPEAPVQEE